MMNILVIYHAPHCNDGFTAAWAAYHGIKRDRPDDTEVLLYPMGYGQEEENKLLDHLVGETYSWIYVVDFSLTIGVIERVLTRQPTLVGMTILDHHKTAFEMYSPGQDIVLEPFMAKSIHDDKVYLHIDNLQSGAAIAYYHWNSGNLPVLVQHVQDRDLWKFEIEHTKAIHMYLGTQDHTIINWDRIASAMETPEGYASIVGKGTELMEIYNEEVAVIASFAVPCKIDGHYGLIAECNGKYASDVGNVLADSSDSYGITFSEGSDSSKIGCSIRSVDDFDVEVIAKKFGGGGHKNAAGFVVDEETLDTFYCVPEVDHHGV